MNDTDGQTIKKLTVRVPIETYLLLDNLARAGRRPLACVARDLLVGRAPKFAPPLVTELSPEAENLLKICYATGANLSQLDVHARAAGEPLARLSGQSGLLFKLGSKTREIGRQTKSGQIGKKEAEKLLGQLEGPARSINEVLARPLNEGKPPALEAWKSALTQLQSALLGGSTSE